MPQGPSPCDGERRWPLNKELHEHKLIEFLSGKMSMADVYQPVIIKELLEHDGSRSKSELAQTLAQYDTSIREYYEKVLMRWPRLTLTKHDIVEYDRRSRSFMLVDFPSEENLRHAVIELCNKKIDDWIERRSQSAKTAEPSASVRYQVLKEAHGKCELCGIPSSLRPIDLDHIIPRSRANKHGKVKKDGVLIDVNDRENLQALCMSCNRAKRASDETDFRRTSRLVRDRAPELDGKDGTENMKSATGAALTKALFEKLLNDHAALIAAKDDPPARLEELSEMTEVILAIASRYGVGGEEFLEHVRMKRERQGGFSKGYLLDGAHA